MAKENRNARQEEINRQAAMIDRLINVNRQQEEMLARYSKLIQTLTGLPEAAMPGKANGDGESKPSVDQMIGNNEKRIHSAELMIGNNEKRIPSAKLMSGNNDSGIPYAQLMMDNNKNFIPQINPVTGNNEAVASITELMTGNNERTAPIAQIMTGNNRTTIPVAKSAKGILETRVPLLNEPATHSRETAIETTVTATPRKREPDKTKSVEIDLDLLRFLISTEIPRSKYEGLTSAARILIRVSQSPRQPMKALQGLTGMTKSGMGKRLMSLRRHGLIYRGAHRQIFLTEKGKEMILFAEA